MQVRAALGEAATGRGVLAGVLVAGVAAGLAAAVGGPALLAAIAAAGLVGLVLVGRRLPSVFLGTLVALLAGYAFLDRGLAHAGVGPLYVGEGVLALGLAALVVSLPRVRVGGAELMLALFMAWGAFRTIPYLAQYRLDALRDAVNWGYAVFALLVIWLLDRGRIERLVRAYAWILLPLALWIPIATIVTEVSPDRVAAIPGSDLTFMIPAFPGSDVAFLYMKPGDAGVHLAGMAAFILAGLAPGLTFAREVATWVGWAASAGIVSALNRGAMLAAASTVLINLFARRLTRWVALGSAGVLVLAVALLLNPTVDVGGSRRLSAQQIVTNAVGIVTDSDPRGASTRQWRAQWWSTIVDYTIDGPYFWMGKGYGINLANDDGFQVEADNSLRAPHSAHFEFLARSGVPGLILWIAVLATFAATVLGGARRAARSGDRFMLAVLGWLFVYWVAAVLNMSVDVYLDGPQGGIPFWCIYGAGIAAARLAGRRGPPVGAPPASPSGGDPARVRARPLVSPVPRPGLPEPGLRPVPGPLRPGPALPVPTPSAAGAVRFPRGSAG